MKVKPCGKKFQKPEYPGDDDCKHQCIIIGPHSLHECRCTARKRSRR